MTKRQTLAPLALVALGGLLVVAALAIMTFISPQVAPTPTSSTSVDSPDDGIPRVSVGDAKAAFDLKQAVFVDVRSQDSYQQRHIPGALAIPLQELESRLDELDPQQWIITYCTWPNEETSARAALILINHGFTKVNAIRGGLQAWIENDYPVEP